MSGRGDGFLARWSRRKIEVQRDEAHPPAPRPDAGDTPVPAAGPAAELTPEEIEALPTIEELTPETDITAFLRKGVPDALKNAALRRMWSLDPAIRDYVGDARDYAYDWNVPGGVPGNGPLLPTDDVGAMLRGMFSEDAPGGAVADGSDEAPRLASRNREAPPAGEPAEAAGPDQGAEPECGDGPHADGPDALPRKAIAASDDPGGPPAAAGEGGPREPVPRPRRHGGAKPV